MKILLVDDHPLFREGIALLLRRLSDRLDLFQASTCDEAFAVCTANSDIDLVLLDLNLDGLRGMDGLAILRERFPGIAVVVMSSIADAVTVRKAIDQGAMGYIPKSSSAEIMLNALRLVLAKGIYLPPNLLAASGAAAPMATLRERLPTGEGPVSPTALGLTPRQSDVLYLVLQGKPIKLICRELGLGEGTVKGHVSAVLRALNVTTRTQAIVAANRLGLTFRDVSAEGTVPRRVSQA
jgi:DNA-binding NarL/FixJ family response regulator